VPLESLSFFTILCGIKVRIRHLVNDNVVYHSHATAVPLCEISAGKNAERTFARWSRNVAKGRISLFSGRALERPESSRKRTFPVSALAAAALVELVCSFLQDILQIFIKLPSNNIDSFVAKLSEGRNRPIVFKCNPELGTVQEQDPNRLRSYVESSATRSAGYQYHIE
jgi:hypothetical protein